MNVREWKKKHTESILHYYNTESPEYTEQVLRNILSFVLKKKTVLSDELIMEEQITILDSCVYELINNNKPLAYIVGSVDFLYNTIEVKHPVLIPRPETEYWCYELIKECQSHNFLPQNIIDIGCGSGCIGIALLTAFENARCDALDLSSEAVELSQKNSINNSVSERYTVLCEDMLSSSFLKNKQYYDIIVANPPYISTFNYQRLDKSVKNWEDEIALTDGHDGAYFIYHIFMQWFDCIKEDGVLIIECDEISYGTVKNYPEYKKVYDHGVIMYDQYNKMRCVVFKKPLCTLFNVLN